MIAPVTSTPMTGSMNAGIRIRPSLRASIGSPHFVYQPDDYCDEAGYRYTEDPRTYAGVFDAEAEASSQSSSAVVHWPGCVSRCHLACPSPNA
jgi:hypothetical protein